MRLFALLWTLGFLMKEARAWGYKNGIFHNSIWLASTKNKSRLRKNLPTVQKHSPQHSKQSPQPGTVQVAVYDGLIEGTEGTRGGHGGINPGQKDINRQSPVEDPPLQVSRPLTCFHVCAAGWFDGGHVGYPIVKAGAKCGFGKVGIVDYGIRLNKSERWDVYCYNPNSKECGGVLTDQQKIIQSPGFPEEYQDEDICYWHIRVRLGQRVRLHFLEFDVEEDTACLADYLEVYDSYDDVSGFAGR
ncbi:hypothetical protein FQN60_018524 [Etheostoma spectabile]|uniref:CUB domain-containing protein n=1 Tax=Etheostoma spectabile TaxID=54343 RepID=A0A5J5DIL2_9PERO|nr:hypothetical protein FQN60_018524 [Etheostoma spectabile]